MATRHSLAEEDDGVALMRVYCGLAATDPDRIPGPVGGWLTVAVVDDAGRLLDVCEIGDDPVGYAELGSLLAERSGGSGSVAVAADSDEHEITLLLAAAERPLAIVEDETVVDYADRFADDDSPEEVEAAPSERNAVGLARALQAGALAATGQTAPRDLMAFKPVLSAHAAMAAGRHGTAVALREVLRELYPAALRAYPDPAAPIPLAILDALPEPGLLGTSTANRGRDAAVAMDLTTAGVADAPTITDAITALRVAIAETPRRTGIGKAPTTAVAETIRQAVAAVRACDAAIDALIGLLSAKVGTNRRAQPAIAPLRAVGPSARPAALVATAAAPEAARPESVRPESTRPESTRDSARTVRGRRSTITAAPVSPAAAVPPPATTAPAAPTAPTAVPVPLAEPVVPTRPTRAGTRPVRPSPRPAAAAAAQSTPAAAHTEPAPAPLHTPMPVPPPPGITPIYPAMTPTVPSWNAPAAAVPGVTPSWQDASGSYAGYQNTGGYPAGGYPPAGYPTAGSAMPPAGPPSAQPGLAAMPQTGPSMPPPGPRMPPPGMPQTSRDMPHTSRDMPHAGLDMPHAGPIAPTAMPPAGPAAAPSGPATPVGPAMSPLAPAMPGVMPQSVAATTQSAPAMPQAGPPMTQAEFMAPQAGHRMPEAGDTTPQSDPEMRRAGAGEGYRSGTYPSVGFPTEPRLPSDLNLVDGYDTPPQGDANGYTDNSYPTSGYPSNGYQTGSHQAVDHQTVDHQTGGHQTVDRQTGSHQIGSHQIGSHQIGSHQTGGYEIGTHETGGYETGGYEPGAHDAAASHRDFAEPARYPLSPDIPAPGSRDTWPLNPPDLDDRARINPVETSIPRQRDGRVAPPWQTDDLALPAEPLALRIEPPLLRLVGRDDDIQSARVRSAMRSPAPIEDEPDDDLLIFAEARSAWFVGEPEEGLEPHWSDAADQGWMAAERAAHPTIGDQTEVGLPRRVPKANLVPGAPLPPMSERPFRIMRDPAALAAHTTGYFRGSRRGEEVRGYAVGGRPGRESGGGWDFSRDGWETDEESEYRSAARR